MGGILHVDRYHHVSHRHERASSCCRSARQGTSLLRVTSRQQRELDIVVLGATGFTGALTAEYLAAHRPGATRWAIAGRNRDKLEALRDRLGVDVQILGADISDQASLRRMAEASRVVVTTVGPYLRYGEPVVAACAEAGTDYIDLTGEIDVVGAGLGTGGHDRLAVPQVRPDRGDDHPGRLGQAPQGGPVADVGLQELDVDAEPVAQRLQLAAVPPGDRPPRRARPVRRQVLRRQGTGEACRAKHDDVQFTLLARHPQQARDVPGVPATPSRTTLTRRR